MEKPPADITFVKAGEAQAFLGVRRQHFSGLSQQLFALVLHDTSYRYPLEYLDAYGQAQIEERFAIWGVTAFAMTAMATEVILGIEELFAWQLERAEIETHEQERYIPAGAFGDIVQVGRQTIWDWIYQHKLRSRTSEGRLFIPRAEVDRICAWQYPRAWPGESWQQNRSC